MRLTGHDRYHGTREENRALSRERGRETVTLTADDPESEVLYVALRGEQATLAGRRSRRRDRCRSEQLESERSEVHL